MEFNPPDQLEPDSPSGYIPGEFIEDMTNGKLGCVVGYSKNGLQILFEDRTMLYLNNDLIFGQAQYKRLDIPHLNMERLALEPVSEQTIYPGDTIILAILQRIRQSKSLAVFKETRTKEDNQVHAEEIDPEEPTTNASDREQVHNETNAEFEDVVTPTISFEPPTEQSTKTIPEDWLSGHAVVMHVENSVFNFYAVDTGDTGQPGSPRRVTPTSSVPLSKLDPKVEHALSIYQKLFKPQGFDKVKFFMSSAATRRGAQELYINSEQYAIVLASLYPRSMPGEIPVLIAPLEAPGGCACYQFANGTKAYVTLEVFDKNRPGGVIPTPGSPSNNLDPIFRHKLKVMHAIDKTVDISGLTGEYSKSSQEEQQDKTGRDTPRSNQRKPRGGAGPQRGGRQNQGPRQDNYNNRWDRY